MVALHLGGFQAGYRGNHVARLAVDVVVAAEVAGIVIRATRLDRFLRFQLAGCQQLGQQHRMVHHFELAAELGILVLDRIQAVRAGSDDLLHPVALPLLHVGGNQRLIQVFVAEPAGRIAAAALLFAEDTERHAGHLQQFDYRRGHLTVAFVKRAGAADKIQILDFVVLGQRRHRQFLLQPIGFRATDAPRIAVLLHALEHGLGLVGEVALHHHQIAPHIDDFFHMLDKYRTLGLARTAGRTGPDRFFLDHVRHQHFGVFFLDLAL